MRRNGRLLPRRCRSEGGFILFLAIFVLLIVTVAGLATMRAADQLAGLIAASPGEKDLIARPASGRAIAAGIAGAKYIEIPGASHAFPVLEPERCATLVLDHLARAEEERLAGDDAKLCDNRANLVEQFYRTFGLAPCKLEGRFQ